MFNHVLKVVQQRDPTFKPGKIIPQKVATTKPLQLLQATTVKLLVSVPAPAGYKKDGTPAKRQPAPLQPGDTVYVRLEVDGTLGLYPFALAGSGYELITNARENVHFAF
jgi:hypothetical protein